ncbi:hypothetical protein KZZ52_16325 [Dactylosporangium sp. AC04546]|uniref:hypothetical protein n=1 Tax=Dactylosporangium sp. AC04546 TaxID=2862460 RepID=UPI001EDF6B5E|nr:hypothetical protein [Dactylosporangium sp. AC04546]WVK86869.1 hypothetical protein KZZ52_16325 [Dactylosporangium sp. AC04546]
MSDYDDGGQLDPGYTGDEQPETLDPGYTGSDQPDVFGQFEAEQEHGEVEELHSGHGVESDTDQQFGVFEQHYERGETTSLVQEQHIEYSSGYDEGEQPSFTGGDVDDLRDRLSGLAGHEHGGETQLGVASN